jgi:hypothetical protein
MVAPIIAAALLVIAIITYFVWDRHRYRGGGQGTSAPLARSSAALPRGS